MISHVSSSAVVGVEAVPVEVEAHIGGGVPKYTVVGLPDSAVRESLDRVLAALKNQGFGVPRGRVTINLAPADLPKAGSAFDLPIAIGLLSAWQTPLPEEVLDEVLITGELALDGALRPVRGVLSMVIGAREEGLGAVVVPAANAAEAAVVNGIDVYALTRLREVYDLLSGKSDINPYRRDLKRLFERARKYPIDVSDVRGQENVKRALEVAAAGGHNVLMVGPPGSGKTMLARRLPTILPPLTPDEALDTTKIHSVGGHLDGKHGLVATRPFRSPHHTISDVGLCGGGSNPKPGEISFAHNGVLFLDELPEFRRSVLEVLRQPMEEGAITISRARSTVEYPASFMLVASMNPCPCGYLNDPGRECICSPSQVQRYLSKISGPLMDRIDLHVEVAPVDFDELREDASGPTSDVIRARVVHARDRQMARFEERQGVYANADMDTRMVHEYCSLGPEGTQLLKDAIERLGLSARAYDRIMKVALTIADLQGDAEITPFHLSEAIQYRSLDREWWRG